MNDDEQQTTDSSTSDDVEKQVVGKPPRRRRTGKRVEYRTLADRRALAIKKAAELKAERDSRIPMRNIPVPLELFELLVAIAENSGAKLPNVAIRAMALGAVPWAKTLGLDTSEVKAAPLTVFETVPPLANANRYDGRDENEVRAQIRALADERAGDQDERARQLHLPGRRPRATAS